MNTGFKNLLVRYLIIYFPLSRFSIYKSFGVNYVLNNKTTNRHLINLTKNIYKKIIKIKSKNYFLKFKYKKILIGDLIYDSYLRFKVRHTADIRSREFQEFIYKQILIFAYWINIFKKNKISAVVLSHEVYSLAFPLRVAASHNIPTYIPTLTSINLFNNKRYYALDSKAYNQNFLNLKKKQKKNFLNFSKIKIKEKFNSKSEFYDEFGKIDELSKSITKNKFIFRNKNNSENYFLMNKKKNIVIYAHCFYDAPHVVKHMFEDFYDWLDFLGKVSQQTDYNWYIKPHPHTLSPKLSKVVFDNLLKKYPKFNILDNNVTTGEILIFSDLILTIYGSAAFEFAYFKKKVVLGSSFSHYKNYNFCLQPKNKKEYIHLIKNFANINIKFDRKEIYQFYLNSVLSFFNPFDILSERKNLKMNFFKTRIFKSLLDNFDERKHLLFLNSCDNFVKFKKFRLTQFPN